MKETKSLFPFCRWRVLIRTSSKVAPWGKRFCKRVADDSGYCYQHRRGA